MRISNPDFTGVLDQGQFLASLQKHYATQAEARQPVDRFLNGWVMDALLTGGHAIEFEFRNAEIVDRMPYPAGSKVMQTFTGLAAMTCSASRTLTVRRTAYPTPPVAFADTPLVERLCARFKQYHAGKEALYPTAYFFLTELTHAAAGSIKRGARPLAAARFRVDVAILDQIGEWSSERGCPLEARKAGMRPPTADEYAWLDAALRAIIRQVVMVEDDHSPPILTMADLPAL